MKLVKSLKESLQEKKPYLFWRWEIDDLEWLLEQAISLQDPVIVDEILKYYDFDVLKDVMINQLYYSHNTLFAKRKYDKVFNYMIWKVYQKKAPKTWTL